MEDNAGKAFHSQCMEFWVNKDLAAISTATYNEADKQLALYHYYSCLKLMSVKLSV